MSPKKLRYTLYAGLGISAIFGPVLVWLVAEISQRLDEDIAPPSAALVTRNAALSHLDSSSLTESRGLQNTSVAVDASDDINVTMSARSLSSSLSNNPEIREKDCLWVNRTKSEPSYFLTAVVLLRIYKNDKANLTTRELKQWLEYMRYIGVEHVYLYDAFYTEDESQADALKLFLQDKYVTYTDWHEHNPYTISGTQVSAYQNCIGRFGSQSTWQTAIDIDEYPFSPVDTEPGFLTRFVEKFSAKHPHVSEISMQNFLFLGKPLQLELLIERLWRRSAKPSNPLVKPIYKPANVRASIHHNHLMEGSSMTAPVNELRMNHYWGARLQNWGEDTPEILAQTIDDRSMENIVQAFKKCEQRMRPYLR